METKKLNVWEYTQEYGDMFYKRAAGVLEEMESSKAVCKIIADLYQKDMKLLDVGCGAGHYLRSLKDRLDNDIDYTGVDATEYYISLAQKAFPENAKFQVADIFNIPFDDGAYDIVMSNNVLLHLPPSPRKAIEELIRVSNKYTVIRTIIGKGNYIVKEIRHFDPTGDSKENSTTEHELITSEENLEDFVYYNMYTENYFKSVIHSIDPDINVKIIDDDMWKYFDNTELTCKTGTKVVGDHQVSGNLLFDWKFIVMSK